MGCVRLMYTILDLHGAAVPCAMLHHWIPRIPASHAIAAQPPCDRRWCPPEQETIESGNGQRQHRGPLHIPDIVAEADASGDDKQQAEQVRACRDPEQPCSFAPLVILPGIDVGWRISTSCSGLTLEPVLLVRCRRAPKRGRQRKQCLMLSTLQCPMCAVLFLMSAMPRCSSDRRFRASSPALLPFWISSSMPSSICSSNSNRCWNSSRRSSSSSW